MCSCFARTAGGVAQLAPPPAAPAPLEGPASDAIDGVRPAMKLGLLELEVGQPAGARDENFESPLLAADVAQMLLMGCVALEESVDARGQYPLATRNLASPKRRPTAIEDAEDHGLRMGGGERPAGEWQGPRQFDARHTERPISHPGGLQAVFELNTSDGGDAKNLS